MPNFSGFSDILKQHLPRHKARTGCPANIIIAIFVRQTVNPAGLKGLFSSKAKPESPYRRMQRFFSGNFIGKTDIARFIFALFGWQSVRPTLDRTTWEYGKSCINIPVPAVVRRGVAIPILWKTADKKGNSNTGERTALPDLFRGTFPDLHIETLYADREFIGNEWPAYLRQAGISCCIRCKENAQIAGKNGARQALKKHFWDLKTGEGKIPGPVMLYGQQHYLEATRLPDGQLPVVCSDKEGKGIREYGGRRQIESLFGCLKSKGFNPEDTHMTAPEKMDRLMTVLATGFVPACRAGEAEDKRRRIRVKKHGRKARSLFRAGPDRLVAVLFGGIGPVDLLGGNVLDLLAVREKTG
mgnify:CR=1 FL=1